MAKFKKNDVNDEVTELPPVSEATTKSLDAIDKRVETSLPRPLGILAMIKEEDQDDKTPGGIIKVAITKDTQFLGVGVVLDVGEGIWTDGVLVPPNVKKGDRVLYPRHQSNRFKDEVSGVELCFVPCGNILCVLPPKKKAANG